MNDEGIAIAPRYRAMSVDDEQRESRAYGLNDLGWVAGRVMDEDFGRSVATLWIRSDDAWHPHSLDRDPEYTSHAAAVNRRGDVAVVEHRQRISDSDQIYRWSFENGFVLVETTGDFRRMDENGWILTTHELTDHTGGSQGSANLHASMGATLMDFSRSGAYRVGVGTYTSQCEYIRYENLPFFNFEVFHPEVHCSNNPPVYSLEAVNERGEAVGRGALYSHHDTSWVPLVPRVVPRDINDRREIVGEKGYVWFGLQSHHIEDLLVNPTEFTDIDLVAINENSEIAANGTDASGRRRALLLQPIHAFEELRCRNLGWPGAVDETFRPPAMAAESEIESVLVLADGRTLLSGWERVDGENREFFWQLDARGNREVEFTGVERGGLVDIHSMITLPDGRVILGGSGEGNLLAEYDPVRRRFHPFPLVFGGHRPRILSLAPTPDAGFLAGGEFSGVNGLEQANLVKIKSSNLLDGSFRPSVGHVRRVVVAADGGIYIGGIFSKTGGDPHDRLARFRPDGALDSAFVPESAPDGVVQAMALDTKGRLAVGFSRVVGYSHEGALVRFLMDGRLDDSFNAPESWVPGWHRLPARQVAIREILVQPDGRLVVAGWFHDADGFGTVGVVRLEESGSIDRSFVPRIPIAGSNFSRRTDWLAPTAIAQGPESRMVIAESSWTEVLHLDEHNYPSWELEADSSRLLRVYGHGSLPDFSLWKEYHGLAEERADDDAGGYGIPNLLRYALAMDPHSPTRENLPRARTVTVGVNGEVERFLGISFTRRPDAVELEYVVEVSDDLKNWIREPKENVVRRQRNADGTETVTIADWVPMGDAESNRRFMRLRVRLKK